ncbi:hypothetical protein [Tenacibaculum amylolyticum]|uniref:hypothetical protein n=1 Tax=Tenacibaculum amylolyticum TaxID=104269 RepID=UPI0038956D76
MNLKDMSECLLLCLAIRYTQFMKFEKIITILFLILAFSCQNGKKKSETKTDSRTELENSKTISNPENNENIKKQSESITFRNITKLEKYKGFEKVSGEVLSRSDKALVYIQKDSLKVLILERIIKNSSPKPNYSILDEVIFISKTPKNHIALTSCELIEKSENEIIFSLVEDENVEYFKKVLKSWVIDLEKEVFREIESKKVKCYNIHYGYDG